MEIRIIEQAQTGQLTVRLSGVSPAHIHSLCQSIGIIACQRLSIREWEIDAQQRADALRWIFDVRATIRNVTVVFLISSPGRQQLRLENKVPSRDSRSDISSASQSAVTKQVRSGKTAIGSLSNAEVIRESIWKTLRVGIRVFIISRFRG